MRKPPTQKTLKKLFALSGNNCAFPVCDKLLVNSNGDLIANVCHIEAAEENGERYNAHQTDEERRHFNNLIVLCPYHHSETNNVDRYNTSFLQSMKADHEKQNHRYSAPISAIKQAQKQVMSQVNTHHGSGSQQNNQADTINVYNEGGLSPKEMTTYLLGLLGDTSSSLSVVLNERIRTNLNNYKSVFAQQVYESNFTEAEREKLATNPDVNAAFHDSVKNASRKNNSILHKELALLVTSRVKSDEDNLNLTSAYSEAINIIPYISGNQLKILSFAFVVTKVRLNRMRDWPNFITFFSKLYSPFLDASITQGEYEHLAAHRCGTREIGGMNYMDSGAKNYPALAIHVITRNDIQELGLNDMQMNQLFEDVGEDKMLVRQHLRAKENFIGAFQSVASDIEDAPSKAEQLYGICNGGEPEFRKQFMSNVPTSNEFTTILSESSIEQYHMTSIGIIIAAMHLEATVGMKIDPSIWVKTA